MKSIGGYFELELSRQGFYHKKCLSLNSGRNCLDYILMCNKFNKIFIPYFICNSILEPIMRNKLQFEYYHINNDFEILYNLNNIKSNEAFLYVNYFGIKTEYIKDISTKIKNLIIDNTHAFFNLPINNIDTFYSPRKFFGVPDGGYLYTNNKLKSNLQYDNSFDRFKYLLIRADLNAQSGYIYFKENEKNISSVPLRLMSKITKKLLLSINYNEILKKRHFNFQYLHNKLKHINKISSILNLEPSLFVYPFYTEEADNLKDKLLKNNIFTATYWVEVLEKVKKKSSEYSFVKNIVNLPIDQRINYSQLKKILNLI